MNETELRVPAEALRRSYDPAKLGFETTAELEPLDGITGQDRALAALHIGLGMKADGFNVYAAGQHGIGKMTALQQLLADLAAGRPKPADVCYVHNFEDPYSPRALVLPDGTGRQLRDDMHQLIQDVLTELPLAFDSEEYREARTGLGKALAQKRSALFDELNEKARAAQHRIKITPVGILMAPRIDGKDLSEEEVEKLPEEVRERLRKQAEELEEAVHETLKTVHKAEEGAKKVVADLDREVTLYAIGHLLDAVVERYAEHEAVLAYLEEVRDALLERAGEIRELEVEQLATLKRKGLREFRVNLLVDKAKDEGAPLIVELNPSYVNLFGKIEKEGELGGVFVTDFTMIRPGSVHRANGGYLVIPVLDLLRSAFSWDALKRTLRSGEVRTEDPTERLGLISTKSLRPDPVPLDLKVVLVGPPLIHLLLYRHDPDFRELFKIKADFDVRMLADEQHVDAFLRFLRGFSSNGECSLPLDAPAAARLLEHSARVAGDQERLSTLFGDLCDVVREAEFWAKEGGATVVGRPHVAKAIAQRTYRESLYEDRIQELIEQKVLRIHTEGQAVGVVNGLSVLQLGGYSFGRPTRISASVGIGREGIVDIERKVELGGPVHSKGVMILHGFLTHAYGAERPLSLTASLAFEQSYSEVDGDSASSTELYALISAIAQVPLEQGIAVTGSVDQRGRVQAVGGINEKIEGFYEVCKAAGLTGEQGVMIPRSNLRHLMLDEEVVAAVREGTFHVWSVEHIDEGLQILTGKVPGERGVSGDFPPDSIHGRVEKRLKGFVKLLQNLTAPAEEHEGELVLPGNLPTGHAEDPS